MNINKIAENLYKDMGLLFTATSKRNRIEQITAALKTVQVETISINEEILRQLDLLHSRARDSVGSLCDGRKCDTAKLIAKVERITHV